MKNKIVETYIGRDKGNSFVKVHKTKNGWFEETKIGILKISELEAVELINNH